MKRFFGIHEQYRFEWNDLSALLTLGNVILIILNVPIAPYFGIANAALCLVVDIFQRQHINLYTIHLALIVMNIYFLW